MGIGKLGSLVSASEEAMRAQSDLAIRKVALECASRVIAGDQSQTYGGVVFRKVDLACSMARDFEAYIRDGTMPYREQGESVKA
jgi:hypothetical protein